MKQTNNDMHVWRFHFPSGGYHDKHGQSVLASIPRSSRQAEAIIIIRIVLLIISGRVSKKREKSDGL